MYDKLKLNYFINVRNPKDLKTKYYKYINENINLKQKNEQIRKPSETNSENIRNIRRSEKYNFNLWFYF